jgi:hypothetical protein
MMWISAHLKKNPVEFLMYFYSITLILLNFGLSGYALESNTLLGTDFWAYRIDNLYKTVMSSASVPKGHCLFYG